MYANSKCFPSLTTVYPAWAEAEPVIPSAVIQLDHVPAVWNKVYRQGGVGATYPTDSDVSTVSGVTHKRIDTALAGFILLSIFNLLLLAILGTAPTNVGSFNKQEMGSTRDTQMTNTTTTTPYVTSAGAPAQGGVAGAGATVV